MNSVRQHKNKVFVDFDERGDNFTLDVPHKNKWLNILSYLRRRGFNVGENPYYKEHYGILSKFRKSGTRGEVAVALNLNAGNIEIDFGHIKNLWDTNANFWDDWHSNYVNLNYLEQKRYELEIHKFLQFLSKWNFEFEPDDRHLTDTEKIIACNKTNSHVHGGDIETLEDIGKYLEKHDHGMSRNGLDSNKKKIICGDTKYFYDSYKNKRMMRGTAYHNINNMWWVMINGKRRNMASYELFDFSSDLPRRRQLSEQDSVQRWKQEITRAEKKRNYKKAEALWKKVDNFTLYNVWSLSNGLWFRPGNNGYTSNKSEAGVYTKQEIDGNQSYYNNGNTTESRLIIK
jgi:hypothetical protein